MDSIHIWNGTKRIKILNELHENITKLCNINDHLFLLTASNQFFHGRIERDNSDSEQVHFECHDTIHARDIDCNNHTLFIVDQNGKILIYNESLEMQHELLLVETKTCCHGQAAMKNRTKACKLSVGEYGNLFISENGQLWASGSMPQIAIDTPSHQPKKVAFFDRRYVQSCNVGNDFAVVVVSKLINDEEQVDSEDEAEEVEEDALISSCSHCLSSSVSQNSLSENCQLDSETMSSDSRNKEEGRKNIIFRNTEAAKEYLSRQFSWMRNGEEYLSECTEKPTRIIKENVSSMASLVYEGVKTVGDKVVTLSRHVSNASDHTDKIELNDDIQMPRVTSKDESLCSMSQCTEERDVEERDVEERCKSVVKAGSALLDCEVWTWGNIVHGQLGIGDIIKRERPMIITKLSNVGAQKVTVQSFHAGVLTLDGRAFLWGKNAQNQVTTESISDQSSPRLFPMQSDYRIKDLTCCDTHTSLLTSNNLLKYIGKCANKQVLNLHLQEQPPHHQQNEETMRNAENVAICLISSKEYTLLNRMSMLNNFIIADLTCEQKFIEEMIIVHSNLIKPLQKKTSTDASLHLFEQLCTAYTDLLHFSAANVKSLLDFSNKCLSECEVVMIQHVDEHIHIYKNYLNTLHCIVSLSSCSTIRKLVDIPIGLYRLTNMTPKRDKNVEEQLVCKLLSTPLERLQFYESFTHSFVKNTPKVRHDILSKWTLLIEEQTLKREEAAQTRDFWLTSGRAIDHLKKPMRRIIKDSHTSPLFLQNGSRFASNWFVLMTDVLIHVNASTVHIHDLRTIWVEPQEGFSHNQYVITLKMPEELIELYTTEAQQKVEWFHALQNAIKCALGKGSAHQPPAIRTAAHTFIKNRTLKDAVYNGQWLIGKMHGKGILRTPDGSVYNGHFYNNQMHGIGQLEDANKNVYKGQWKDGMRNGFGIINYSSGDMYRGYFKDDEPHGHGYMKQGDFMSHAASIYIGDWWYGQKFGYGIMDDITTGEKYLGNWCENKKNGNGLIVTADGVYYEGIFNQGVLMGHGIMIFEDGTHYEGDFKGTGVLSGKGTLRLKSGHVLEGSLTGSWSEGIKISSGVLTLPKHDADEKPKTFGTFCTPVDQKWKGLFKHYYQLLGVTDTIPKSHISPADTQKAWQNVAVIISSQRSPNFRKDRYKNIETSLNSLDKIPDFGMDSLDLASYQQLKVYLHTAFEYPTHPLGTLLNDLTEAFSIAYGSHANCLLISHAIRELHFITIRLYDVVRLLFPSLPQYGKEVILEEHDDESGLVSCQIILHPIILPRVHSALFTLYTLNNKLPDSQYWKRLLEWNKQPDSTLMAFLHVDQKFCTSKSYSQRDQCYQEAVETLQLLLTTFSPMDKLLVIKQTFRKITGCVQQHLGVDFVWCMDDLFPVCQYVVVRARISQLGSELAFIEDFMEANLESGELGIMFTTLKACYHHILQEELSCN